MTVQPPLVLRAIKRAAPALRGTVSAAPGVKSKLEAQPKAEAAPEPSPSSPSSQSLPPSSTSVSLNVQNRTVKIEVQPPPASFAERRAVLLALKRVGPVEMFKKLPGHFIALVGTAEMVAELARQSPLLYRVAIPSALEGGEANPAQAQMPLWGMSLKPVLFPESEATSSSSSSPLPQPAAGSAGRKDSLSVETKHFAMTVMPYSRWNHGLSTKSNMSQKQSLVDDVLLMPEIDGLAGVVLQKSVPAGVAARGLSRWDVDEEADAGPAPPASRIAMARARKEARARRKWELENVLPGAMLGLPGGGGGGAPGPPSSS